MLRVMLVGLLAIVASGMSSSDALAQRDAGAKARGDQRAFWDSGSRGYRGEAFSFRVRRADAEPTRRFSYEPMGIEPGEMVTVSQDGVKVMRGTNVVGTMAKGTPFKVLKVVDGWLGTVTEVNGKMLDGWVWHKNVSTGAAKTEQKTEKSADMAQAGDGRRYSYEPTLPAGPARASDRRNESWNYPKTDPRRFRP